MAGSLDYLARASDISSESGTVLGGGRGAVSCKRVAPSVVGELKFRSKSQLA